MKFHGDALRSGWAACALLGMMLVGCGGVGDGSNESEVRPEFELGIVTSELSIQNVAATYSAWSGKSAAQKATLSRLPADGDYVEAFSMEEKSDDPCHFNVLFDDVDTQAAHGNEFWDRCDGSSANWQFARLPSAYRTTGLAVCLNSDRNKMKGFALIGRYPECIVDPNGTTPTGAACNGAGPRAEAIVERDNCPGTKNGIDSDWEDEVECPPGYVVTGIELNHIAGDGNRRMMNGARAICHPLLP